MSNSDRQPAEAVVAPALGAAGHGNEKAAPKVERLARVEHARPGDYWRATEDVTLKASPNAEWNWRQDYEVEEGTVLLIADVRKSGDQDHTVVLQRHPADSGSDPDDDTTVWVLLDEFYAKFEHAPDAAQVREQEIGELQARMAVVQGQISRASTDQGYLNSMVQQAIAEGEDHDAPKGTALALPGDVQPADLINSGAPSLKHAMSAGNVAVVGQAIEALNAAKSAVQRQANWFVARAKELSEINSEMMPFMLERASVAMARNRGAVAQAERLMEGVSTMSLFTGEKVRCSLLVDGEPAPADAPIKLFQRKLWLDEECSLVSKYLGQLYCTEFDRFVDDLAANPPLQDLLIPAQRGVVLVGVSRQRVHFGDSMRKVLEAVQVEVNNKMTFMLVRDGQRWFSIDSPIPSHEHATMLFPMQDIDGSVFGGIDGDRVTVNDLRWTKQLDELHSMAVHFRRFAVTLAGLIAKEKFWQGVDPMMLFTGAGNASLFQLVSDASGEGALADGRESFDDFLKRNRETIRVGSRVLVNLTTMVSADTAPNAYKRERDAGNDWRDVQVWLPVNPLADEQVQADGADLYITSEFMGRRSDGKADKRRRIRVTICSSGRWSHTDSLLAVDRLDPEALDRHMHNRDNREHFMQFMAVFRRAKELAIDWLARCAPLVKRLADELEAGGICSRDDAPGIALRAVGGWVAADPEKRTPNAPDMDAVRLLAFRLSSAGQLDPQSIEGLARDAGFDPLRLVVDGNGRVVLYTADPTPDNRVADQAEVLRHIVEFGARTGPRLTATIHELLWKGDNAVTLLHQWPAAEARVVEKVPALSLRRKTAILDDIAARFATDLPQMIGPWTDEQQDRFVRDYWHAVKYGWPKRSGKVTMPNIYLPFAMAMVSGKPVVLGLKAPGIAPAMNLDDTRRNAFAGRYAAQFAEQKSNRYAEVSETATVRFKNFHVVYWSAAAYGCKRNLWDHHQDDASWVNLNTSAGEVRKHHWHDGPSTYTDWTQLKATSNELAEPLTHWLRLAQLPQPLLRASTYGERIRGLVLAEPIKGCLDNGGSFIAALVGKEVADAIINAAGPNTEDDD